MPATCSQPHTLHGCKVSLLTFILLCLMPSTICSICLKNWSRAAGEAMALKEKSAEVGPACGTVTKGVRDTKESALYLERAPESTRPLQGTVG